VSSGSTVNNGPNVQENKKMYLVTFATEFFRNMARTLGQQAIKGGFDGVRIFDQLDITLKFRHKFRNTLELSRGAGYWVWKIDVIRQTSSNLPNNAVLMYLDCGGIPREPAHYYRNLVKDDTVHVWVVEGTKLVDWTEPEVLSKIAPDLALQNIPMVWAGCLLAMNSDTLQEVLNLWEKLCENESFLRPDSMPNYISPTTIVWHRHDQSLLSILVALHPDLFTVHSSSNHDKPLHMCFNHHRNLKIKNLSILFSFPKLREIRRNIVRYLPIWLKKLLRVILFKRQMKPISKAEQKAIARSFKY
jgi:hypothetical protein